MIFEWNAAKARANLAKHNVSFDDACTVFGDSRALTISDVEHSEDEERHVTIGRSAAGIMLIVVHTERLERVRLISARRAAPREIRSYEQDEH